MSRTTEALIQIEDADIGISQSLGAIQESEGCLAFGWSLSFRLLMRELTSNEPKGSTTHETTSISTSMTPTRSPHQE